MMSSSFSSSPIPAAAAAAVTVDDGVHGDGLLRIASFNLLAPLYVRPIDMRTGTIQPFAAFDWITEENARTVLGDEIRLPKLHAMLRGCECDFICLQELQLERARTVGGGEEKTEGSSSASSSSSSSSPSPSPSSSSSSSSRRRGSRATGGKRSRKEDVDDMYDVYDDDVVDSGRGFVLPEWISSLVGGMGVGSSCDDELNENNHDNVGGPYGMILPSDFELEKMAERNGRVLHVDAPVTNAILYDRRRWRPAIYDDGDENDGASSSKNTTTCVTMAFRPANDGIAPHDVDVDDGDCDGDNDDVIVVSSVHLDARSEEKRANQMKRCIEISLGRWWMCASTSTSTTMTTTTTNVPHPPRFIIAGDFNSELFDGSCIKAFLLDGGTDGGYDATTIGGTDSSARSPPTTTLSSVEASSSDYNRRRECASALRLPSGTHPSAEQMRTWDALYDSVNDFVRSNEMSLCRIDTGCTRAAYDHDDTSSSSTTTSDVNRGRTMAQWRLDHILYTPSTLIPLGRWATLEDDEHSRTVGLPNERIPTDHMPIAAIFEKRSHPRLSNESRRMVIESRKEIEGRHLSELKTEEDRIKRRGAELERQQGGGDRVELGGARRSMDMKKAMTKKKLPPSAEMIEHIRSGRAAVKQLKTRQRMERQVFVDNMDISEKMVLLHSMGKNRTCSQWVDTGGARSKK